MVCPSVAICHETFLPGTENYISSDGLLYDLGIYKDGHSRRPLKPNKWHGSTHAVPFSAHPLCGLQRLPQAVLNPLGLCAYSSSLAIKMGSLHLH
ncbi:hypothetical protein AVEN_103143-1 [Araneus ventricosus]|uniref:Uncharacterized protein n=1 Tax=Araneus ventricosus TaxID=182803 RepID=A0A4Y2SX52_ARAVE|nr:hypothetical protein AVEN_103143-1 [Araneus ventricosus]